MADLVARLRSPIHVFERTSSQSLVKAQHLCAEAADALAEQAETIQRLRATLQRAAFYITAKMETTPQALAMHDELREALQGANETTPLRLEDHENYCNEHGGHLRDSPACYLAREADVQ